MFKKILFISILFSNLLYSQLSTKHWIPPLHSRSAIAIQDHYLYLSTAETTPFLVTVTDGSGVPFQGSPFSLSAATPVVITVGTGQPTKMFLEINEVNTVVSDKGLILEGTKDFYVSFRLRHDSHSETLISKGRPGIGTSFRLGCMINESNDNRKSFVASVMATEDGTTMTLSDYDTGVIFESGLGQITDDSQSFTLNAGQSVIFSGYSNQGNNLDGIIGALVTSNKPVAVNSGNAIGGIENNRGDFTLDQIVSASQIGTEYIFIQGNGTASMELPLIVAHEDATEIFVNGGATSVTTINAGEYFLVPNSFYQGTTNKNVFVRTTKPVFAYQLLGGAPDTATSGLNFIPPLSCFFQNSVSIPAVNQIGGDVYNADLMILTYTTATITVNGTAIPNTQAQAVLGNTDWVTYRISNITGNANVSSTGPLAVGVFGYQSNISGFAGYYSGFGSNPEDTAVTVCSNQTIDLFEAINGNPLVGGNWTVPAGGAALNANIFDAVVNLPGEYIYNMPDCNNPLINIPLKVIVTIEQAPFVGNNTTLAICANDTPINLYNLLGTGAVSGGTWSPTLASGTGLFNPAVDGSGTYVYTVTGNATSVCLSASATVTVTNNPIPTVATIPNFELCDDTVSGTDIDGFSFFDLTTKNAEAIGTQTGIAVTYHLLASEAQLGTNPITTLNSANRTIHVRLRNTTTNCFAVTSFNLVVLPLPTINNIVSFKQCDVDNNAVTVFNLTEGNGLISTDASYVFSYHNSLVGARNNSDLVTDAINFQAANASTVWARITNTAGCVRTTQVNLVVSATTIPQTYRFPITKCDNFINATDPDGDGIDYFDLTEIEPELIAQFPSGQSYTFSYYLTQNDAETEQNAITTTSNFRNTTANNQLIWVRIESNLFDCAGLGAYLELVVSPLPNVNLGADFIICVDAATGVGAKIVNATPSTPGNYSYVWTPANPNGDSPIYTITSEGTFSVIVTNTDTNCVNSDQITSTFSSEPAAFEANLITPAFSSGLAAIEGVATGGFGTYEYSINAIDWQSSPIFSNLQNGSYIIYVRDIQGCGILFSKEIQTITYPNFFTPNGDGYNDFWNISLPNEYNGTIFIFDKYGKLLKQINPFGQGWDGTFTGKPLPSTDYWFRVEYTENNIRKEFKSHFSLKR